MHILDTLLLLVVAFVLLVARCSVAVAQADDDRQGLPSNCGKSGAKECDKPSNCGKSGASGECNESPEPTKNVTAVCGGLWQKWTPTAQFQLYNMRHNSIVAPPVYRSMPLFRIVPLTRTIEGERVDVYQFVDAQGNLFGIRDDANLANGTNFEWLPPADAADKPTTLFNVSESGSHRNTRADHRRRGQVGFESARRGRAGPVPHPGLPPRARQARAAGDGPGQGRSERGRLRPGRVPVDDLAGCRRAAVAVRARRWQVGRLS